MESDTPRTDALVDEGGMPYDSDFARKLERELAAMQKQRDEARQEVCWFAAKEIVVHNARQFIQEPIPTPEEIALERGWDCYGQGGAA